MTPSRHKKAKKAKPRLSDLVPTNWLDPLLTGPQAVVANPPYSCLDIARLLRAVKRRLRDAEVRHV